MTVPTRSVDSDFRRKTVKKRKLKSTKKVAVFLLLLAVWMASSFVWLVQKGVKHVLSHRVIYANFYEVILPEDSASFAQYQRIRIEDLHKFAVSRLVNQFFSLILKPDN